MALTVLDIHRLIEQDVQNLQFFKYGDIDHEEIDLQINKMQDMLVNGIVDKHFGRPLKVNETQGFQKDQVSLDNLRTIHVRDLDRPISDGTVTLEKTVEIPANYRHHIRSIATITRKCKNSAGELVDNSTDLPIVVVESQNSVRDNPFTTPGRDFLPAEIVGNKMIIYITTGYTLSNLKMSYIKHPAVIKYARTIEGAYDPTASVQCELDSTLHYMLQDMTSIRIMKILESNPQKIVSLQQDSV